MGKIEDRERREVLLTSAPRNQIHVNVESAYQDSESKQVVGPKNKKIGIEDLNDISSQVYTP